jgi:hypothetical protein
MEPAFVSPRYSHLSEQLNSHPLYGEIQSKEKFRIFMQHHAYAVWDFMSLVNALQNYIAPTTLPWVPSKNARYANFINQLVLDEESDVAFTNTMHSTHASHFETYCQAMVEIGADVRLISRFIKVVRNEGLETALKIDEVPPPARQFMTFTFDIVATNQPHQLAAVLAYGRETLVQQLFRSLIDGLKIKTSEVPDLFGYLERHIQLDEQEHGPVAALMVQELCGESKDKQAEAIATAEQALKVRLDYWDGIHAALSS